REVYLQTHIDGPDRAEAPDRALILKDEKEARLVLRYQSEARSTFFRAYAALVKAIEGREKLAAALADTSQDAPQPTPEAPPAEGPEAVSRNEANSAGDPATTHETPSTSGDPEVERGPSDAGLGGAEVEAPTACEGPAPVVGGDLGGVSVP